MTSVFKYAVLSIVRNRALLIWPLLFPLIMATLFHAMFASLEEAYVLDPVELGIVTDSAYDQAAGLDETLRAVDGTDAANPHVLNLTTFSSESDAISAVGEDAIVGYVTVDADHDPELHLSATAPTSSSLTAAKAVLDTYLHVKTEVGAVAQENPALLADPSITSRFTSDAVSTAKMSVTRNDPEPSVRYFYALLGMTAGMGAIIAAIEVQGTQAEASPLGARRTLAGIPRWRVLLATLLASWVCMFVCMVAAFAYMRLPLDVDFGGRDGWCLVAIALSSLVGCAGGAMVGTFAKLDTGIISAVTCLLSLFAGLYGEGTQEFADLFAASFPALSAANPVRQTAQSFYALLYYDSLEPFAWSCCWLGLTALLLFAIAAMRMRRQRHAHL